MLAFIALAVWAGYRREVSETRWAVVAESYPAGTSSWEVKRRVNHFREAGYWWTESWVLNPSGPSAEQRQLIVLNSFTTADGARAYLYTVQKDLPATVQRSDYTGEESNRIYWSRIIVTASLVVAVLLVWYLPGGLVGHVLGYGVGFTARVRGGTSKPTLGLVGILPRSDTGLTAGMQAGSKRCAAGEAARGPRCVKTISLAQQRAEAAAARAR